MERLRPGGRQRDSGVASIGQIEEVGKESLAQEGHVAGDDDSDGVRGHNEAGGRIE